ncbi:hypothetical protein NFI96_031852 [Prochilodus magdalenae]|nr:hypothetical protein NFI96_031852 [Prochilodus magdalenae]
MDESLCSEKTCSSLISALPLWIIEYAWSKRMEEVLEVLGPPLWLKGDWSCLSLEDPCSIRVVAAEAWMVIRARDIKHFERVMEFLDVTYVLLPHLVTSIKHMKIMFGLKTLVIMWMLWDDQSMDNVTDKITKLFPDNLPQYQRSSHRHKALMQRTQQDFISFAQSLARNPDMRQAYIRDLIEEQYGERYALKLEERLLHYLEELDKALPQPTCIDQVLRQPWPQGEGEELLQQLLACNTAAQPTALKRLLRCAMAAYGRGDTKQEKDTEADSPIRETFCIALIPSQAWAGEERLLQECSQGSWLSRDKRPVLFQKGSGRIHLEGQMVLKQGPDQTPETSQATMDPYCVDPKLAAEQKVIQEVTVEHMCSQHGKTMKSILLECSEELKVQERETPLAHSEFTPPSPLTPRLQSTPQRLTHSSASLLQDSSSTNISLSSHPDSSSTNISGSEIQSISSSQLSSHMSPLQQNTYRLSSVQQLNIPAEHVLPSPLPLPPQQSTTSPEPSVQHSYLQKSSPSPIASSSVQQESSCSVVSLQQPLLSPVPNLLMLPATQITIGSAQDISALSSAQKETSPQMFSQISSSSDSSLKSPVNQISLVHGISSSPAASSSVQMESSSPLFSVHTTGSPGCSGHPPCPSSNPLSITTPTSSTNCAQVQATTIQELDVVSKSSSVLGVKLKLSLETQIFLLSCKWLQPQVLLYRLSQQECAKTTLPEATTSQPSEGEEMDKEEEANESFDVNLLYSGSESDRQDSDDSDYVPSKRLKAWMDWDLHA